MVKLVVGIDLGLDGALATMDQSGSLLGFSLMPTRKVGTGKSKKRELDCKKIQEYLATYPRDMYGLVVLEAVHSFGDEMRKSLFTFGRGTGKVQAILELGDYPNEEVKPPVWKQAILKGTKRDKVAAIEWANRRYGESIVQNHDGMADALCLAEYARRQFFATKG